MARVGRKPMGPALVHHLEGSAQAKQRLEVILGTIAGTITIEAACEKLEIEKTMLFRLRSEVLAAALAQLEPRPRGRPPTVSTPEAERCHQLEQRLDELEAELKIAATREEVARILPQVGDTSEKKTTRGTSRTTHRRRRGRRPRRQSIR